MPDLRVRPKQRDETGAVLEVTPESAGWTYVGFKVITLNAGESTAGGEAGREACIVVLSGRCNINVGAFTYKNLGERMSVFEDKPPAAVYVSSGSLYGVTALTDVEIAIGTAPGDDDDFVETRVIDPANISKETRGQGTNTRHVRNILPESEPAQSLLIAEVITPGGNWSSYPPHKHDRLAEPEESSLEEIYYHRLNPPQGFAFQRVYTDDRSLDETVSVEDGDVVLVPRGYHPVGAPHGYDLYYLNIMAGPKRTWIFNNDPAHAWIAKKK